MGSRAAANSSAVVVCATRPAAPASAMLRGLPSLAPLAFLAASAAFVRSEISRRSFSAWTRSRAPRTSTAHAANGNARG
jgi:hypothetical protein